MPPLLYPKARLENHQLYFEDPSQISTALSEGVFYVQIPDDFDFQAIEKLATSFYLPQTDIIDPYRGFKERSLKKSMLGYSNPHDQVELLQLEMKLWNQYFPPDSAKALTTMNQVSKDVLSSIFLIIGVKEQDIAKITGGMQEDKALQYCIFNHYRSSKKSMGFTAHKDSGFITTLYSIEPGLEATKGGEWVPIDPVPGYFTINLGHSLEVLSENLIYPVHAVYHRVRQTRNHEKNLPDRFSVGSYIGPRFDMDLFQYQEDGKLEFFQTFMDFQIAKAKEMNYEFHPRVK